ncbi:type VI secretion system-associated FHA domain protein [Geoalkalibacter halelectricus]|uniref:type VI secretion system-associated FHA domain protein n=1 Tax=Geoalkalibacter halelectricus TaxID=2847045 RepID=UPI003D1A323A
MHKPKKSVVTRLDTAAAGRSPTAGVSAKSAAGRIPAQALIAGLARMIEGLRCFADEFGLAQWRVLGANWEEFQGRGAEEVLRGWLRDEKQGAERIERLFEDLMDHQMALLGGLEGVAREAAEQFNPRQVRQRAPRMLGLSPGLWRNYCRHFQEVTDSDHQLYRSLLLPGFVTAYAQAREKSREVAPSPPTGAAFSPRR